MAERSYWDLIDPIWKDVSIYDGPEVFLHQLAAITERQRHLLASHWCYSEVCNGGFGQFFENSTGVLGLEAALGFASIGMPKTGAIVGQAIAMFGADYPRQRTVRIEALEALGFYLEDDEGISDDAPNPFNDLDDAFFDMVESENEGYFEAATTYAFAE